MVMRQNSSLTSLLTPGQQEALIQTSTWPTSSSLLKFAYSDVDATGFDYAWGQVPQMPADYPVDDYLHGKIVELLREKSEWI